MHFRGPHSHVNHAKNDATTRLRRGAPAEVVAVLFVSYLHHVDFVHGNDWGFFFASDREPEPDDDDAHLYSGYAIVEKRVAKAMRMAATRTVLC